MRPTGFHGKKHATAPGLDLHAPLYGAQFPRTERIADGNDLRRKETSGMKWLWILMLLLMPMFAGGCKVCYSWQLGRDRAAEPAPAAACALYVLHPVNHVAHVTDSDHFSPSRHGRGGAASPRAARRRRLILPRAAPSTCRRRPILLRRIRGVGRSRGMRIHHRRAARFFLRSKLFSLLLALLRFGSHNAVTPRLGSTNHDLQFR